MEHQRRTLHAILILFFTCPLLAATVQAQALATTGRTSAPPRGIQLTLSLDRTVFPRNALVRVTVRARNISAQAVTLSSGPDISVLNSMGQEVYSAGRDSHPPIFPSVSTAGRPIAQPKGGGPFFLTVRAGQVLTQHVFLVLRGSWLQPRVGVFHQRDPRQPYVGTTEVMTSRPMRVQLTQEVPPQIIITTHSQRTVVTIKPGNVAWQGVPRYMAVQSCGISSTGTLRWTPASNYSNGAYHLRMHCAAAASEWHLAVAWLNHPLGRLDYVR